MSKELGKVLKFMRKRCELTQRQVAEVLHIDRSTYAYYESGTTEPDLKSISKLARIFNIDPMVLLPNGDGAIRVNVTDIAPEETQGDDGKEVAHDLKTEKIYSIAKEERGVLIWYRTLTSEQKERFIKFAQELHDE